jgi:hypothetical protein
MAHWGGWVVRTRFLLRGEDGQLYSHYCHNKYFVIFGGVKANGRDPSCLDDHPFWVLRSNDIKNVLVNLTTIAWFQVVGSF